MIACFAVVLLIDIDIDMGQANMQLWYHISVTFNCWIYLNRWSLLKFND